MKKNSVNILKFLLGTFDLIFIGSQKFTQRFFQYHKVDKYFTIKWNSYEILAQ